MNQTYKLSPNVNILVVLLCGFFDECTVLFIIASWLLSYIESLDRREFWSVVILMGYFDIKLSYLYIFLQNVTVVKLCHLKNSALVHLNILTRYNRHAVLQWFFYSSWMMPISEFIGTLDCWLSMWLWWLS